LCLIAFENCLVSLQDENEKITSCSQKILSLYLKERFSNFFERDVYFSKFVAPRSIELMTLLKNLQMLKTTCSRKDIGKTIILLKSYLQWIVQQEDCNGIIKKTISASFSSECAFRILRDSFQCMLDIEIDFSYICDKNSNPKISENSTSFFEKGSLTTKEYSFVLSKDWNIHHNQDEKTIKLVKQMIRQVGILLGPKRCILFVDGCFMDFFSVNSPNKKAYNCSSSKQRTFLKKKKSLSSLLVAKEILIGCFIGQNDECNDDILKENCNLGAQCSDILFGFLRTIIPMILVPHLWNTPTKDVSLKLY